MGDRSNGNSTSFTTCNGNGNQKGGCSHLSDKDEEDYELEIVTAVADFCAIDDSQLSFESGQVLSVLRKPNVDWWWARKGNNTGYIPTNHIATEPIDPTSKPDWQDDEYFGSYSTLKLQQEMLSDKARNEAYQVAIERNKEAMKGKVVLDVGCGTGILSMMCVKYGGAKRVHSIEASEMAETAEKLINHNNLSNKITLYHGKVEGTTLPEKVDLIISEWMGTLLIFEFMVESVLIARDKWLKQSGKMWPSQAHLFLAPTTASKHQDRIHFWDSVCGLDYSILRTAAKSEYFCKPVINEALNASDLLAKGEVVYSCDLNTVTLKDLEMIKQDFSFTISKQGTLHGFASWFSVEFEALHKSRAECVVLDTSPHVPLTHWKQAALVLDDWYDVEPGDAIQGTMRMERSYMWRRHFRVGLSGTITFKNSSKTKKTFMKTFKVWR
ncbi:protein arginine N-methyltransferase 2 [Strongylocentrotus purpuratus]|uniref:Protein arginine N-methyltransferase 2 n=1 Tax=Strongylocentrotus purpuratus TaxID=7668 RepID=A0A7M7RGQ2_STRPU|nr:protein arginine N-methyltransferase 2 [Strongylocentrotus purpuratus]|eukprot:XP_786231.3 PREDICTED: protein arginine N-methyltransferase 2 [Strongylocentrotus purpuratus]